MKQKSAEAERKLGAMSVKKNVRIEMGNCYYIGESPDGKKLEGFGTTHFNDGNRYEGDHKDGKIHGTGNKSPSTPIPPNDPPPPPPNPIKCLLLLLLLLCGGFLSLFCIRKENFY